MFNISFYTNTGKIRESISIPVAFAKKLVEFKIADTFPTQKRPARGCGERWQIDAYVLTDKMRTEIVEMLQHLLTAIISELILGIKVAVLTGRPIENFIEQATFVTQVCQQFAKFVLDRRTAYYDIS